MKCVQAHISKMSVAINPQGIAQYQLKCGDEWLDMNALIGRDIRLTFSGEINCIHCGRRTNKSFNQGYCFPCVKRLARCDTCIIKPEKCHYDEGTCREPEWGQANCMQAHFVYLANTGAIKVGITRHVSDGVSSRWIDQGATQAMPIYRVQSRKASGLVEVIIAQHIADKTNWRTMLKGDYPEIDLSDAWQRLKPAVNEELETLKQQLGMHAITELRSEAVTIHYPVMKYPAKVKSINFDKQPIVSGQLLGIKGQYLMLNEDRVLNIRNASGYQIGLEVAV